MAKKIRTQLYLDQDQKRTLDEKSRQTGKSLGCLVREAIDRVYRSGESEEGPLADDDPIWGFIGGGESKEGDLSVRHDHYLYESEAG